MNDAQHEAVVEAPYFPVHTVARVTAAIRPDRDPVGGDLRPFVNSVRKHFGGVVRQGALAATLGIDDDDADSAGAVRTADARGDLAGDAADGEVQRDRATQPLQAEERCRLAHRRSAVVQVDGRAIHGDPVRHRRAFAHDVDARFRLIQQAQVLLPPVRCSRALDHVRDLDEAAHVHQLVEAKGGLVEGAPYPLVDILPLGAIQPGEVLRLQRLKGDARARLDTATHGTQQILGPLLGGRLRLLVGPLRLLGGGRQRHGENGTRRGSQAKPARQVRDVHLIRSPPGRKGPSHVDINTHVHVESANRCRWRPK